MEPAGHPSAGTGQHGCTDRRGRHGKGGAEEGAGGHCGAVSAARPASIRSGNMQDAATLNLPRRQQGPHHAREEQAGLGSPHAPHGPSAQQE